MLTATKSAARTYSRQDQADIRSFLAALRRGEPSIGWGPQCIVLGPLPAESITALCVAIEVYGDDCMGPVQFRDEIARCAKRNGAKVPALHVRLCDALANFDRKHNAAIAALILATVEA